MSLPRYVTIEKAVGETPLAAIERFRARAGIPKSAPLSYAGRLDPLASGVLVVLIGEECKQQAKYHALDKAYDFDILTQFSSDTGDVLGLADFNPASYRADAEAIRTTARAYTGTHTFPYPHYSSKTVNGKPLFLWTLEGRLSEITIPTIRTTIHSLKHTGITLLSRDALKERIAHQIESIPKVTEASKALGNDFRRPDIRARWEELFATIPADAQFAVLHMEAIVESGTYIRSLAPAIALALGTSGLALRIHRSTVGRYQSVSLPFLGQLGQYGWWRKKL